ncbi:uncharacterized protein LOC121912036 [Thunnus maccoyii]|uniref:uncharacterized protein LOC121912036 n=1 Tax=Thunnus maccoyii TaxID=8240 RepID=UPI001C4BF76A|nr:uncharacterized protein LOC121912036 [Thunnus maccoyii]
MLVPLAPYSRRRMGFEYSVIACAYTSQAAGGSQQLAAAKVGVVTRQLHSEKMLLTIAVHLCLFSCVFLQHVSAEDIVCNVTQDGSGTHYSVPEFKAEKCHYSWTNINDSVLANHEQKMDEIVARKSSRTLFTYKCYERISYKRDCISEGTPRTATCTRNCTGFHVNKDVPVYVIIVVAVAVVILVPLGLLLCNRLKLCRKR